MEDIKFGRHTREQMVAHIKGAIDENPNFIVTNFSHLNVIKLQEFRRSLDPLLSRFEVVKNSMVKRAFDKDKFGDMPELITGQCGIGLMGEDIVSSTKAFVNFSRENETFNICGGYVDGQALSVDQIKQLASLPSREELIAQILMRMKSPIYGFVNTLSAVIRGLVNVVDQLKKKKEEAK